MATPTQAPIPIPIPVELYLHTVYEPAAEYVDGKIEERPMGENEHSAWQQAVAFWFELNADKWNILVRPELRVQTGATTFRVPDVAILDASLPREPITTHPPIAVFEVLSPEDYHKRLIRKLGDYRQMGIPSIWVIDPETGLFERFEDTQLVRRSEFHLPQKGISFPVAEIARLVRR